MLFYGGKITKVYGETLEGGRQVQCRTGFAIQNLSVLSVWLALLCLVTVKLMQMTFQNLFGLLSNMVMNFTKALILNVTNCILIVKYVI